MTGVEYEIVGLERNLLRTVKLIADGDLAVVTPAYERLAPWGDGEGNPYTLRRIPWREYREILIAKQIRRRERLVSLIRKRAAVPRHMRVCPDGKMRAP